MQTSEIIHAIDVEIEKLRQAKALLLGTAETAPTPKPRGRPKGSTKPAVEERSMTATKARRPMSPEGKARIAAAQKARWAAQRKSDRPTTRSLRVTAKKVSVKKAGKKLAKATSGKEKLAADRAASSATASDTTT